MNNIEIYDKNIQFYVKEIPSNTMAYTTIETHEFHRY